MNKGGCFWYNIQFGGIIRSSEVHLNISWTIFKPLFLIFANRVKIFEWKIFWSSLELQKGVKMHNTNSPKIVAQGVPPIILTKKLINKTPYWPNINPYWLENSSKIFPKLQFCGQWARPHYWKIDPFWGKTRNSVFYSFCFLALTVLIIMKLWVV